MLNREEATLKATNKNRDGWTAVAGIVNGRAVGRMMCNDEVVRNKFSVAVDSAGKFKVDVGTGAASASASSIRSEESRT